jgi:hypothetical protein
MRISRIELREKQVSGSPKKTPDSSPGVGFFMGEGEYHELSDLERLRKEQGWHFGLPQDGPMGDVLKRNVGKPIVINGGSAYECVALLVDISLRAGVSSVTVPLDEIYERGIGVASREDQLRLNASRLARGLRFRNRHHLDDPRIHVEPNYIWSEERAKVIKD